MANRVCSEVNALISSDAQLTFLLLLMRLWSCPSCQGKQHSCKIISVFIMKCIATEKVFPVIFHIKNNNSLHCILSIYRDPDTIHTSSNEAYQLVKQTGGRDDGYETVTTIRNVPPSFQPTAGDSLYEQV